MRPSKLERYFARYEFNTEFVLCASDCESMPISDVLALEPGAAERFASLSLAYTESQGSPTLREEVASLYEGIEPHQILVTSGAEEAIYLFMRANVRAGDHVIVHSPCYQSLIEIPRSIGCDVEKWVAREEADWRLDTDELNLLLRSSTRAIVLNTPHNPTGFLMSLDDFQTVVGLAKERDILLFSDEVYRESEHDPGDRLPAACDLSQGAISLGVMSKAYGLPGLRIGWVATRDSEVLRRMAEIKDYTTICSAGPSEFLAEVALRNRAVIVERNLEIIRANLAVLEGFFARHTDRFAWKRPSAGPVAFPAFLGGEVEEFCTDLAENAGVLLLPGTVYDDGGNHFRIGFGRRNLPQAVERFDCYLQQPA